MKAGFFILTCAVLVSLTACGGDLEERPTAYGLVQQTEPVDQEHVNQVIQDINLTVNPQGQRTYPAGVNLDYIRLNAWLQKAEEALDRGDLPAAQAAIDLAINHIRAIDDVNHALVRAARPAQRETP